LNQAGELYSEGRFAEAVPLYQQAVRIDPASDAPHLGLANTLLALNRTDEALAEFRTARDLKPVNGYYYATALFDAHKYDEAETEFKALVARSPGDCTLRVWIAMTLERRKRFSESLKAFEDAKRIAPSCTDNWVDAESSLARAAKAATPGADTGPQ
jgi:tetratricopeptide (TPR) repeat protein